MADTMYGLGKQKFADGEIDWTDDTIRVYLVDTDDYTPNFTTDEFLSDIPSAARVAYATLTGKTNTLGVCDASNTVLSSVTGDQSEALVLVKWVTGESDSPLIVYKDSATGLPVTPDGSDITIAWDSGANKIFAL